MKLRTIIVSALAALTLAACSDEAPVVGPGTLTATLTGPNRDEGAAVLTLLGGGIGALSPVGATELHARDGRGGARIVLINQEGGALSFQVAVADTTSPPAWVIVQVAGPDDALRTSVDGYTVEYSR